MTLILCVLTAAFIVGCLAYIIWAAGLSRSMRKASRELDDMGVF